MFLFFHGLFIENNSPVANHFGRYFALLFPVSALFALVFEPRRVSGWVRKLIVAADGPCDAVCACVTLVSTIPYFLLLLASAGLAVRYTLMFYRAEMVF